MKAVIKKVEEIFIFRNPKSLQENPESEALLDSTNTQTHQKSSFDSLGFAEPKGNSFHMFLNVFNNQNIALR